MGKRPSNQKQLGSLPGALPRPNWATAQLRHACSLIAVWPCSRVATRRPSGRQPAALKGGGFSTPPASHVGTWLAKQKQRPEQSLRNVRRPLRPRGSPTALTTPGRPGAGSFPLYRQGTAWGRKPQWRGCYTREKGHWIPIAFFRLLLLLLYI